MFVITGATGNTGGSIARQLLAQKHKVRAVARNAQHLHQLELAGAEAFVCDLSDAQALQRAFSGATAVYAMIPPNIAAQDVGKYQDQISAALATAIQHAGVNHVVALSSIGADMPAKTGPILGLRRMEERLSQIGGLNCLCLRAGYFMENTLAQIGAIQSTGKTMGPLRGDLKLPMIATRDIASAASEELAGRKFNGFQTRELLGQRDLDYTEATRIIGRAVSRNDLSYSQMPSDQMRPALMQMGMSASMADALLEMCQSLNSEQMRPSENRNSRNTTPTAYEQFVADVFVPAFNAAAAPAPTRREPAAQQRR